ncbi:MAG: 3-coathanger stack domain-containing protein, partial [Bacteroidota bacterium]
MTFDHKNRKVDAFHQVIGNVEEHCSRLEYTNRDLVRIRHLGGIGLDNFLQEVNYSYNGRRWLTRINDVLPAIASENTVSDDLFYMRINYNLADNDINAPSQKTGNIAKITWQTLGEGKLNLYGFQYDFLDRITQSTYAREDGNGKEVTNDFGTTYAYDLRGNITQLTRSGRIDDAIQLIDSLDYEYLQASNQIKQVTDESDAGTGIQKACCVEEIEVDDMVNNDGTYHANFRLNASSTVNGDNTVNYKAGEEIKLETGFSYKPNSGQSFLARIEPCNDKKAYGFEDKTDLVDYNYDVNGNRIADPDKNITIRYNYLDLPYQVDFGDGKIIEWLYNADGTKLRKRVIQGGSEVLRQDYLGEFEYQNEQLEAIYHSDGRVISKEDNSFEYQYNIIDNQGNTRVVFRNDGSDTPEIISKSAYYPYG